MHLFASPKLENFLHHFKITLAWSLNIQSQYL